MPRFKTSDRVALAARFTALSSTTVLFAIACGGPEQEATTEAAMATPDSPGASDDPDSPAPETSVDDPADPVEPAGPGAAPSEPGDPIGPDTPTTPSGTDPLEPTAPGADPGSVTRVARLSHAQYRNTVADLLGIDDPPGDAFAPDALNGFEFDTTVDYPVDARLGPQYRAAAEALGARAASEDLVFEFIVPCDAAQASCASEFVASFGQRAFRRPLGTEERTRFETLFASGAEWVASGDAFRDGVQVVVEAMLQSPQFLYRTELSTATGPDGAIQLDGWEIATRLSYFLWNSMPDDELFAAAASGLETETQIEDQVTRMLGDPRATAKLVSFHEQAWQFGKFSRIAPDPEIYPDAPADLAARASESGRRFVEDVVQSGGGLRELLTAPYAYADEALAPLYGVDVSGDFTRVDFDDGERKGILMQLGFLASNSYAIKTDPIHRGLFVVRNLLCRAVPDPPAGAAEEGPPPTDTPPVTTRDEVALLTGTNDGADPDRQGRCGTCHALINPAGFAFENFDAAGQQRTTENGAEIDTTGSITLGGQLVEFADASELVELVAASEEARACYASKLVQFAQGHDQGVLDAALTTELVSVQGTQALAQAIARAVSFRQRAVNEVAP